LQKDPRDRIDDQVVSQHPWFEGIHWDDVAAKNLKPLFKPQSINQLPSTITKAVSFEWYRERSRRFKGSRNQPHHGVEVWKEIRREEFPTVPDRILSWYWKATL
jgi:hypothetical protein